MLSSITIARSVLALADCYETLTAANGIFASPNYPGDYFSNSSCYWLIRVASGSVANLTFITFQVESRYDVVSVYDGSTTAARLLLAASNNFTTHPVLPPSVVSSTNEMLVVFTSNDAVHLQGFSATYESVINSCTRFIANQLIISLIFLAIKIEPLAEPTADPSTPLGNWTSKIQ